MKSKWKTIIAIIVVLDIVYLAQYAYTRFPKAEEDTPKLQTVSVPPKDVSKYKELPLDYGDQINNHIIADVAGDNILLTNNNRRFKYVKIIQPKDPDLIVPDDFVKLMTIRKDFTDQDIDFFFLVAGEFTEKKKIDLSKLQKKFKFQIGALPPDELLSIFSFPDCKCGFTLFLDRNNRVRMANKGLTFETIRHIMNKEIKRTLN